MKRKSVGIIGALAVALAVINFQTASAITITVTPWSSPNAFGSPSYAGAVANNIYAQTHGLTSYGNPSLPTYYAAAPANMQVKDNIVTGYPSWKSSANPVVDYGADFGSELGNRLLFGVRINGQGTKFSISQLGFNAVSTDPGNSLGFGFGVGSYNYSLDYQGWLYGADGVPGGVDDTFITSGSSSQLVDGLVGRGSGNAWASYLADPGASNQDKLNGILAAISSDSFTFTGEYTIGDTKGSGKVTFNASSSVPDTGSTVNLLGAGIICLIFIRRVKPTVKV